jgi:AraC-like DNA-binding protein
VERACELLRSANLTVTEICHLVGFASMGTFSARFAEITGMSPTACRRQARRARRACPHPGLLRADVARRPARGLNASLSEKRPRHARP